MELEFLLIDVFTDRPFGGSRLNFFPAGQDLPVGVMQEIAMELGCGETAFLTPGKSPGENRSGLRVFTPAAEIPFGGHSVLGATFALDELGLRSGGKDPAPFRWELEAGHFDVITSDVEGKRLFSLIQDAPVFLGQYFHRGKVARTLGGMARKARSSWLSLKRQIEAEMRAEELKEPLKHFENEVKDTVDDLKKSAQSVKDFDPLKPDSATKPEHGDD